LNFIFGFIFLFDTSLSIKVKYSLGVGTGPLIDSSISTDIQHLPSSEKDESYNWIFTNPDKQGKLSYRAGFDWQSAGDITGSLSCHTYLDSLIIR
tara:strand:+ start:280 stop:564 length:285 start_codon:yes stop_codon:yes gene_type:complete